MKKGLTQIVFVLDMSGSMSHLTMETIGGYNTMIADQKKEEGDALVTTVLFDHRYIMIHDGMNIKEVKDMTTAEYMPAGMTAMLDAVGMTINHVGQKLAAMPEWERPEKVLFTIITDGYENSSKEFDWPTVKNMIKHQREKYNWIFTFLGANIDIDKVSDDLGIDQMLSKKYTANNIGTQSVFNATSKAVSFVRSVDVDSINTTSTLSFMSQALDEVK